MEDYYTIQTPGHQNTMFTELHTLQKQGVMCDVILAAEDGEVMAHKVVLMAASKYFREKLSPIMGPVASKICLKGISVVELANLVKYIYTGKLLVAKETMDITLEISEILELNGVLQGYKEIISNEHKEPGPAMLTQPSESGDGSVTKKAVEKAAQPDSCSKSDDQNVIAAKLESCSSVTSSETSTTALAQIDTSSRTVVSGTTELPEKTSTASQNTDNKETAPDFNFDTLFDQQYLDVSAGSRTPSKISGTTPPQVVTPPKMQKLDEPPADSQKMAAERAQHQDLLAVAIESLSDVPHLRHHPQAQQQEIDKAVLTISGDETVANAPQQNVYKPEDEVALEEFENGKTKTKTVTLSAGSVSNELGGKTDVYTVALDPSTVKAPLKMPRPKRTRTLKEREAELKEKMYRLKKAEVLEANAKFEVQIPPLQNTDLRRGKRQRSVKTMQDFQYESVSKERKRPFQPRILLSSKTGADRPLESVPTNLVDTDTKSVSEGADNIQDDVDGMIADNIIATMKRGESAKELLDNTENAVKTDTGELVNKDYEEMDKESGDDEFQANQLDDMSEDRSRSSATKRKTRTPRKLPLSDEERGNDSGTEHNVQVENTKKKLNLDKKSEARTSNKDCRSLTEDSSTSPKTNKSDKEGDNIPKNVSQPTEIKIVAQKHLDLDALAETEKLLSKSGSKKIIIVPKEMQPKIRLRKRTEAEMMKMAKDIARNAVSSSDVEKGGDDIADTENDASHSAIELKSSKPDNKRRKDSSADTPLVRKKVMEVHFNRNLSKVSDGVTKDDKQHCQESSGDSKGNAEVLSSSPITRGKARDKQAKDDNKVESPNDESMSFTCSKENCFFTTTSGSSLRRHEVMYHEKRAAEAQTSEKLTTEAQTNEKLATEAKTSDKRTAEAQTSEKRATEAQTSEKLTTEAQTNEKLATEAKTSEKRAAEAQTIEKRATVAQTSSKRTAEAQTSSKQAVEAQTSEKKLATEAQTSAKSVKSVNSSSTTTNKMPISPDPTIVKTEVVDDVEESGQMNQQNVSYEEKGIGADLDLDLHCDYCGKTFKSTRCLKKHIDYAHSDRRKLICEQCDFTTPFESSMSTHIMLKHTLEKPMLYCKYCTYTTPLTGNLRKHILGTHGLFIVTQQLKKKPEYAKYPEGTILTKDGELFDPEVMQLPKLAKRYNAKDGTTSPKTRKTTKIALSQMPVEDFLKEMMKRHEDYIKQPEKKYSFMSDTLAVATEHPSFPQASPQVRNTRADKIYNMKKLKPTLQQLQMEQTPVTYGLGNIHGFDQGAVSGGHGCIPHVANEVVVQDNVPEVVVENVETDPSAAVLTISEHRNEDGSNMIIINQNGKQTVVRSKDFYDTLEATGQDSSQTLGVISALLQAGEQIEIREQEEIVEIQNM